MIDVPFIPLGADIQMGDLLVTSGIDGTYPTGLAVASVNIVDGTPPVRLRALAAPVASSMSHRRVKSPRKPSCGITPNPTFPPDDAAGQGRQRRKEKRGRDRSAG